VLILHTYLFFPVILRWLAESRKQNENVFLLTDSDLPEVAILLAVHNEEEVIARKIQSVYNSEYPADKIHFYIGSDNSTDKTDEIIKSFQQKYPKLYLRNFPSRTGKAAIVNALEKDASQDYLILTDANVFFDEYTVYHLIKHFRNTEISVVGGNILNERFKFEGISFQEKKYLERENVIKYREGLIWGTMIGAFGGCYSIRKSDYQPVPKNFLMDDFFITMNVLKEGKKAINELEAVCYEDVSNKISEEFRRKVRISAGNFQNLMVYKNLLWPPFTGLAFSFFSHKVLRWITPFLIIITLVTNYLLVPVHPVYVIILIGQVTFLLVPFIDTLLKKIAINFKLFRFITHFYSMNLALLVGFFKYSTGVKTNIWRPTERNQ
jgi:cellulose synthase/poly-beta-1,6-N-acetylglucosamine synthase-like glycosyltransferase